jgi:Alkylmercury lyase
MTQQTGPESAEPRADNLTGPARQVHQAALAEFARTGQPPVRSKLERLTRSLGASPDAVLAELAEADAIVFNDHGEIRAAYPFSPVHTPIRVSWPGGPAAYAMCAIDALGMSAMLGHPVTITAAEPDTGHVITVHVDGSRARWRPRSTVVFAGSAGDTCRPSVDRSCGYINFFASRRSARAWASRHPEVTGRLLTREGALGIGIAEFGNLLQAVPPSAVLDQVTADPKDK